jgi:biofilm PGA synthesis N-glycosyltransferase PgaC
MTIIALRIIEKLLIIYFLIYFAIDIGLFLYSLLSFRKKRLPDAGPYDYTGHPLSIIVPAYNEAVSIVHCMELLLELEYPNYEILIVNDGSSDATIDVLNSRFGFTKAVVENQGRLTTAPIRNVYRSSDQRLTLIDKYNGGKADSINAGINFARGLYICTIDADSILDSKALTQVVAPFIADSRTIVAGGQLAAANDMVIAHNTIVSSKTPANIWVLWQIVEYIKSFMISRIGLSRTNTLLIMSGAFSLYKKADLLAIGGFLTARNDHPYVACSIGLGKQTVCEDMEIVVRLWQYKRDAKIKAKTAFLPEPVCWTEVPDNGRNLFRQRSRWHQGLAETLFIHRAMMFEPGYGATGLVGLPYYFFFELLAPLVKIGAAVFIIVAAMHGLINYQWAILLLVSVMLVTAIILSSITAVIEHWSQTRHAVNRDALRYKNYRDWLWMMAASIIAEFSYSIYKIAAQVHGLLRFLQGKNTWNTIARRGLHKV